VLDAHISASYNEPPSPLAQFYENRHQLAHC
jgi:hypothetical protein